MLRTTAISFLFHLYHSFFLIFRLRHHSSRLIIFLSCLFFITLTNPSFLLFILIFNRILKILLFEGWSILIIFLLVLFIDKGFWFFCSWVLDLLGESGVLLVLDYFGVGFDLFKLSTMHCCCIPYIIFTMTLYSLLTQLYPTLIKISKSFEFVLIARPNPKSTRSRTSRTHLQTWFIKSSRRTCLSELMCSRRLTLLYKKRALLFVGVAWLVMTVLLGRRTWWTVFLLHTCTVSPILF